MADEIRVVGRVVKWDLVYFIFPARGNVSGEPRSVPGSHAFSVTFVTVVVVAICIPFTVVRVGVESGGRRHDGPLLVFRLAGAIRVP